MITRTLLSSALAIAAIGLVGTTSANAATRKCTCTAVKKHAKRHYAKRVVKARVVETAMVSEGGPVATYYTPDSGRLPDTWYPTRSPQMANAREVAIADDLNRSLDLFRICGWRDGAEPAAVFVSWSRTHSMPDRDRTPQASILADDAYARISSYKQRDMGYPPDRFEMCSRANRDYPNLKMRMDQQAAALAEAHHAAHAH